MSDEYEIEVVPVVIAEEPIELYKILKIENLVASGSEAKNLIAEGYVYVNGEVETRKRKKIMFGDIVGFNGEAYLILSPADMDEYAMAEIDVDEPVITGESLPETEDRVEPEFEVMPAVTEKPKGSKKSKAKNQRSGSSKKKGRAAPFNF